MPFPLAHPAAALPFRRFCPRWLNFPALVVGSLVPDAGYVLKTWQMDRFSHSLLGAFGFSLPVGILALLVIYGLGRWLVPVFPAPFRRWLEPMSRHPLGAPLSIGRSVLLGALLHLLWDSFTHKEGWAVQHLTILHTPVALIGYRTLRVCHLLWYASTFAGIAALGLAYQRWLETARGAPACASPRAQWCNAICLAALALPLATAHHFLANLAGSLVVVTLSLCLAIVFAWWVGKPLAARVRHGG